MHCKNCGTKINEGVKFCALCGTKTEQIITEQIATNPAKNVAIIKCGNCGYIGQGAPARHLSSEILAWLCVVFAPIIPIIYYVTTHKFKCPKCHSTFIGIKNQEGAFISPRRVGRVIKIVLFIILGIAVTGILSSIILATLNTAREKGNQAIEGNNQRY